MANNKAIDFFRSKKKIENIENYENSELAADTKNTTIIEISAISSAMKKLSGREKEVFEFKHFFNYKITEIAEKLQLSEGAVKRYLFDATLKIREMLK